MGPPRFARVTDCVWPLPTGTLTKLRLEGFTVSVPLEPDACEVNPGIRDKKKNTQNPERIPLHLQAKFFTRPLLPRQAARRGIRSHCCPMSRPSWLPGSIGLQQLHSASDRKECADHRGALWCMQVGCSECVPLRCTSVLGPVLSQDDTKHLRATILCPYSRRQPNQLPPEWTYEVPTPTFGKMKL